MVSKGPFITDNVNLVCEGNSLEDCKDSDKWDLSPTNPTIKIFDKDKKEVTSSPSQVPSVSGGKKSRKKLKKRRRPTKKRRSTKRRRSKRRR